MTENKIYLMMNKPAGYVCSAVSDSHKTVYQLLPPELQALVTGAKRGHRLHTIGRLDCETTGLLLLTTDGELSNQLTRPENHHEKTYVARLKTPVAPSDQPLMIEKFAAGLTLPPEKKAPEQNVQGAVLKFLSPDECEITIKEGKFHQVRRSFLAVQNEVTALHRKSVGKLILPSDLQPGHFLPFTPDQVV